MPSSLMPSSLLGISLDKWHCGTQIQTFARLVPSVPVTVVSIEHMLLLLPGMRHGQAHHHFIGTTLVGRTLLALRRVMGGLRSASASHHIGSSSSGARSVASCYPTPPVRRPSLQMGHRYRHCTIAPDALHIMVFRMACRGPQALMVGLILVLILLLQARASVVTLPINCTVLSLRRFLELLTHIMVALVTIVRPIWFILVQPPRFQTWQRHG